MLTTMVTIATIGAPNEDPKLFWKWKFFIVNGDMIAFTDGEDDNYHEGFVDGIRAVNPKAVVTQVVIDAFDVEECFEAGEAPEQNKLIKEHLDRLIPLGTILEE